MYKYHFVAKADPRVAATTRHFSGDRHKLLTGCGAQTAAPARGENERCDISKETWLLTVLFSYFYQDVSDHQGTKQILLELEVSISSELLPCNTVQKGQHLICLKMNVI